MRSRRVMEMKCMTWGPYQPLHPALPLDHKLAPPRPLQNTDEPMYEARMLFVICCLSSVLRISVDLHRHEAKIAILVGEKEERRLAAVLFQLIDVIVHVG